MTKRLLPAAPPRAERANTSVAGQALKVPRLSGNPSVLVVDDSSDGREMLSEYLAFRGFQVTEAQDGREALETARRVQPNVILMDLSMPVVDGWEATRLLKADPQTKNIVVIAVTAHAFPPEQESARVAGCDAIIAKPYDLAVLANALSHIASKGLAALDALGIAVKGTARTSPH